MVKGNTRCGVLLGFLQRLIARIENTARNTKEGFFCFFLLLLPHSSFFLKATLSSTPYHVRTAKQRLAAR